MTPVTGTREKIDWQLNFVASSREERESNFISTLGKQKAPERLIIQRNFLPLLSIKFNRSLLSPGSGGVRDGAIEMSEVFPWRTNSHKTLTVLRICKQYYQQIFSANNWKTRKCQILQVPRSQLDYSLLIYQEMNPAKLTVALWINVGSICHPFIPDYRLKWFQLHPSLALSFVEIINWCLCRKQHLQCLLFRRPTDNTPRPGTRLSVSQREKLRHWFFWWKYFWSPHNNLKYLFSLLRI